MHIQKDKFEQIQKIYRCMNRLIDRTRLTAQERTKERKKERKKKKTTETKINTTGMGGGGNQKKKRKRKKKCDMWTDNSKVECKSKNRRT